MSEDNPAVSKDQFREGQIHYRFGEELSDSPYRVGSHQDRAWCAGWNFAKCEDEKNVMQVHLTSRDGKDVLVNDDGVIIAGQALVNVQNDDGAVTAFVIFKGLEFKWP